MSITNKFNNATVSTRPDPAALTAQKLSGATSITVDTTAGWPQSPDAVHFVIYQVNASGEKIAGTQIDCKGIVTSSTAIGSIQYLAGTDGTFPVGSKVICTPTAGWVNDLIDGLTTTVFDQDGTLKAGAVDVTAVLADNVVTGAKITATDGLLRNVIRYTYDGTDIFVDGVDQNNGANTINWTKPAGLKFVEVELRAGGGGGGGVGNTSGTGTASGGGQGEYAKKKILTASLGATETVTVGVAGAGATAGNNVGGTGGTTSFGSHVTAIGGAGGLGSTGATQNRPGGAGGSGGTGADIAIRGANGHGSTAGFSGGGGGEGGSPDNNGLGNGGIAGQLGGGGTGALDNATTSRAGGDGGSGYVIVKEYF